MKKIVWRGEASEENMYKRHYFGNWCDLGTFWSDFSNFRMQNHSV